MAKQQQHRAPEIPFRFVTSPGVARLQFYQNDGWHDVPNVPLMDLGSEADTAPAESGAEEQEAE